MKNDGEGLRGKVAVVTGGARGLGAALCRSLAEAGMTVEVADCRRELAEETARGIREAGGSAAARALDVSDEGAISETVDRILGERGRIDVLVNNAGIDKTVPIEELSSEDWRRVVATNLTGPFLMAKRVLPAMKERGSGHVVNIVSTAAKRAWANATAYHASKWGLLGLSHAMHCEAKPANVKVTAVISGGMRTPFLLERFPDIDVGTLQEPEDVARMIRYVLCAPRNTAIPEIMVLPMRETSWP